MPRLIDADALHTGIALYAAENAYINDTALDVLKMVSEWLNEAPTIDARPVRHGRWRSKGLAELECTICKYTDVSKRYSNYCPNCGNPMDGGAER